MSQQLPSDDNKSHGMTAATEYAAQVSTVSRVHTTMYIGTRSFETVTGIVERAFFDGYLVGLLRGLQMTAFDLRAHLQRQREWSEKTFGPSTRTEGVLNHIRKELDEITKKPHDLSEWIDVVILALDGAWRHGYTPDEIIAALVAKQTANEQRVWPDWRTRSEDEAIEHVKPCADGHVWSNQFGDDWTPEKGARCDCGQRVWK